MFEQMHQTIGNSLRVLSLSTLHPLQQEYSQDAEQSAHTAIANAVYAT
jgi:hypothetical protein